MDKPKRARIERDRRFLVASDAWRPVASLPRRHIRDRYLACGRLRVRAMTDGLTGERLLKLTKKHETDDPLERPIVTILLSETEYQALWTLDGFELEKTRYYVTVEDRLALGVDVFGAALAGLVLSEMEAGTRSELDAAVPPAFAHAEVTHDPFFMGGSLARTSAHELARALARYR